MTRNIRIATATAVVLALTLAGCGKGQEAGTAEGSAQADAAPAAAESSPVAEASGPAAPAAFVQCKSCHAVEPGKHGIGPSLAGVYGTKAGDIAGYTFSPALKASGLTWDDATLDKWLAGPMKLVPGTKMTFAGLSDPAQRQAVIDYMKTLK
ncbi:MAG: c-type cytochrome [Sphingomonadales bacterium]|nr:c-type cytochrome [Sphingomonadales bacterium]